MDDLENIKSFLDMYEKALETEDNDDYQIDLFQLGKLANAYNFFCELVNGEGESVELEKTEPKRLHGGVTAKFYTMCLSGVELKRFCDIMSSASAVSIDAFLDGRAEVSLTIPNIYRHK